MPSVSDESFRTLRPHHPHHFEFESVREVPDSHAWPDVHDHPSVEPSGPDSVPVVDLASPDAVLRVGRVCEEWGVFQVTGHGVSSDLLDRLESQIRRLFSLPTHQKFKAARSPGNISGYGLAPISSFFSKLMCDVIEEYKEVMKELAGRLMHLMLLSLGLTEEDISWAGPVRDTGDLSAVLQLNSYPVCPEPDRAMGLAAHTDSSLLTVLYQSSTSGLQVLRPEPARWVTVPPLPGALVVNVGDLSHILSNGQFRSVLHRAVVNRTRHRLSVAYICGPPAHVKVSPVEKLVGPSEGPAYRAVTWSEYLGLKGKLFNKALASIKLPREEWGDCPCSN
ncbi:Gibberellin 3-beta-dioxygenase 1 [Cocos nucifera]|uniref:Gibberellin 3-beta-dioxygenase 1 n=1 Tax=Cocos nucifera TaxID=13894 RepID=A0A8K0MZH3_COCNU|nr:Gibberellin 3-beta-dioxygenase 1 [Cocos nucifera]